MIFLFLPVNMAGGGADVRGRGSDDDGDSANVGGVSVVDNIDDNQ